MTVMMTSLKRLWCLITGKKDVRPLLKQGAIIPAFVCNGVQYYQWAATLGQAVGRWVHVSAALERCQTGCTKQNLDTFISVMEEAAKKGDMKTVKEQVAYLKVRSEWAFEPESAYELAATMFFDLTEDPAIPDLAYTQYKVAQFKKHLKPDFFLQVPFSAILTITASSTSDFQQYMLGVLADLLKQYRDTLVGPYNVILTKEQKNYIALQVQQASLLMTQYGAAYGSTT